MWGYGGGGKRCQLVGYEKEYKFVFSFYEK